MILPTADSRLRALTFWAFTIGAASAHYAAAAEPDAAELAQEYAHRIQPLLKSHCHSCHGGETQEAELDLRPFTSLQSVVRGHQTWETIAQRLEAGEMPPEDAEQPLPAKEREAIVSWARAVRRHEAERNAGDPGLVPARRLSNAEYNYTIRDLTDVDIRPAREFPVDPANEAGFDASSESLTMSPALLGKYLGAAREVASHLALTPTGIRFAPHPVLTDTDRDKYCVKRIVDFYLRQPTDYAAYFEAAWRFQHRDLLGRPEATLGDMAAEAHISSKYLATVWQVLNDQSHEAGPLAKLRQTWRGLPAPTEKDSAEARQGCQEMRDYVVRLRAKLTPRFDNLDVDGIHKGAQPFVLWKNGQYAAHRRKFDAAALKHDAAETELVPPADEAARKQHEAAVARFAAAFPDVFYISERGRDYVGKAKDEQEKGRLLSAGFHSMMGYYRDDRPLYDMVLSESERAELDALWQELDFVTSAPLRQYTGFVWFERTDSRFMRGPEFDFARSEDKLVTSEPLIRRLAQVYLDKAKANGGTGTPIKAIEDYFETINAQIRWVEGARLAAEPAHVEALVALAERAWRRPLAAADEADLRAYYRELREREQLSHEEAIQDLLVSILLSPQFCYRLDLAVQGEAQQALSDFDLASRLSYFLWSSLPDQQLLDLAAAGTLHEPAVLATEARRMLKDPRARALAVEFGGNWLDFRRFEEHNSVDRGRFPIFTNDLRQAMFEEPIRYLLDGLTRDASVLELLYGRHTFANPVLARHYGFEHPGTSADDWIRFDDVATQGRGGLLPMSVFLTQNAPGLRTSPVKRGYWVVRRLLGEQIPPPPPNVPELPADESQLGQLSLRDTLAKHREHASCAACHDRFDAVGLVFEGYGPIGERRTHDLGGRAVDASATFPDSSEGAGIAGLKDYLRSSREQDFLDNLSRKLLSYGLGRTLLPSDDGTIATMRAKLAADDYRWGSLIETVVTSPQFRHKRGHADQASDIHEE